MSVLPFVGSETRQSDSGYGFCGSCGCELSSTEAYRCTACTSAGREAWRQGQTVVLAPGTRGRQVAFIVRQRGRGEEYPGCFDVLWVDSIGAVVSLPYAASSLRHFGNVPGYSRPGD